MSSGASQSPDLAPEQRISSYEGSTQFKNWRYSVEQLENTRTTLNEAAVTVIRNTFESDEVLTPDHICLNAQST